MKHPLALLTALFLAPVAALPAAGASEPSLNIVLIIADDLGYRAINCGKIPSPAVALFGFEWKIPSIMVTGSHIPDDRNALARALDFANGFKVLEKSLRVGVTNFIRHCRRQPARTARAKRHTAAHHEFLNGNFHKQNYLATSAFDFSL